MTENRTPGAAALPPVCHFCAKQVGFEIENGRTTEGAPLRLCNTCGQAFLLGQLCDGMTLIDLMASTGYDPGEERFLRMVEQSGGDPRLSGLYGPVGYGDMRDEGNGLDLYLYNEREHEHPDDYEDWRGDGKLPPDPEGLNDSRAELAAAILDAFVDIAQAERESALRDLLANLMHWCDRHAVDFQDELAIAADHYTAETAPES